MDAQGVIESCKRVSAGAAGAPPGPYAFDASDHRIETEAELPLLSGPRDWTARTQRAVTGTVCSEVFSSYQLTLSLTVAVM